MNSVEVGNTQEFDPKSFNVTARRTFHDLKIGDVLIGFIEQSSKFLKGVYIGDTLYPQLTICGLIPQRTTGVVVMAAAIHNQNSELVLTGEQKYLLRT